MPKIEEEGHIGVEPEYVRKTGKEIRALALAVHSGMVFGSWSIPEHDMHLLTQIFMPLLFMSDLNRKALVRDGVVHFYGNVESESFPRSINGYPMFHAIHMLNREDTERMIADLKLVREFAESESD